MEDETVQTKTEELVEIKGKEEELTPHNETKSLFKPKRRKNLRKRCSSDDSDSNDEKNYEKELKNKLADTKLLQSLRRRQHGVSVAGLGVTETDRDSDECGSSSKDVFKSKAGGMVNMQALRAGRLRTNVDDAYDTGIGTQFSVETNKRDEDEEMMRYIEHQLLKRKGNRTTDGTEVDTKPTLISSSTDNKYMTPEEAALRALPTHLRESSSSTRKNEEMLSNQMLNGIPEVDLGIEAKIKNIEATEEAKLRLLDERNSGKRDANATPSQFVPTNMAVNFTQHGRFNVDQTAENNRKRQRPPAAADQPEDKSRSKKVEKATDDYHYEKFKKQFRKY